MSDKSELVIVKIGGKLVEDKERLADLLKDFTNLDSKKILVHGGGKSASQLIEKLGLEPKMVGGRRITDAASLEVVTMVYAGLINKNVVAQLQALGINALGLSGADLNSIQAHKRIVDQIDYGFAGDIDQVNATILGVLLEENICPVFCAITHDKNGQLLNTNADTIAAELAKAMAANYQVKLIYCFEKPGVLSNPLDDSSVIKQINPIAYESYKSDGTIADGMIPKMDNAFQALKHNVAEVYIASPTIFKSYDFKTGTKLCL